MIKTSNYLEIPEEGDYLVFVRSRNFLARVIQLGMWLFQIIQMRRYPRRSPNHTDIVVGGLVVGAIGRGVDLRTLKEAYGDGHEREFILFDLSKLEGADLYRMWNFLIQEVGSKYEFSNFLNHVRRIFGGKWVTYKRVERRFYCIELSALAINRAAEGFCENPHQVNPIEFLELCETRIK